MTLPQTLRWIIFLLVAAFALTACNNEGVAGFSPINDRIAFVTNNNRLYVTNPDGSDVRRISDTPILTGFDVSFDPTGAFIMHATTDQRICIIEILAERRECPITLPAGAATGGILTFLPNSDVLLAFRQNDLWTLDIYQPNGTLRLRTENIGQLFTVASAFKSKRLTDGTEWLLRPENAGDPLRWVTISGGVAALWQADEDGVTGPLPFANSLDLSITALLNQRNQTDITSGTLSPSATHLAFRTVTSGNRYDLYVVNLNDASWVRLVSSAETRVNFAFSPDGRLIAYENNASGGGVWLANVDGSNARQLAANGSLPAWHVAP